MPRALHTSRTSRIVSSEKPLNRHSESRGKLILEVCERQGALCRPMSWERGYGCTMRMRSKDTEECCCMLAGAGPHGSGTADVPEVVV